MTQKRTWVYGGPITLNDVDYIHNITTDYVIIDNYIYHHLGIDFSLIPLETVNYMKNYENPKKLIASVSLTEAETWRDYYDKKWHKSRPDWLGMLPIENNRVRIARWWHPDWWAVTEKILAQIIDSQFDGIMIDRAKIEKEHYKKFASYVGQIGEFVKKKNKDFIIFVVDNEDNKEKAFVNTIDGIVKFDFKLEDVDTLTSLKKDILIYDEFGTLEDEIKKNNFIGSVN